MTTATTTGKSVSWSIETISSSASPSSGGLDRALHTVMEKSLRQQIFRSLSKIERHLSRRDPQSLQCIRQWYSSGAVEQGRLEENPQQLSAKADDKVRRQLRPSFRQRRMEQHEIDTAALEYLKIPKGIATRSLMVPPQPDWLFADRMQLPQPFPLPAPVQTNFAWLPPDSNASNAEELSRRFMEREFAKQNLEQWVFLYFRVLRRSWESTVVEEKRASPDVNMYDEEHLHKWTVKLRFRILRKAPVKVALNAFLTRLGLKTDDRIVFCRDGFYGLMDVGNIYGEKTKTPFAMVGFSSTPRYLGLKNCENIFVNSCSISQRHMMEDAHRQDEHKSRQVSILLTDDDENEEYNVGEFYFDDEDQDDSDAV